MTEDILSVIFLAFICIVIAGISYNVAPNQRIYTFVLIAVCLWIALDYITVQRNKAQLACNLNKQHNNLDKLEIDEKIKNLKQELNITDKTLTKSNVEHEQMTTTPTAHHKNEFDIDMYDKQLSTEQLFKDSGCAGDTRLANRMKYMGLQARMSQDIRARWNAEKYRPFVEEELRDGEKRDWWENDAEYLDLLM